MKPTQKISVIAATVAVLAGSAFADSPQLQKQLELERMRNAESPRRTTIGVYASNRGVGHYVTETEQKRTETKFGIRTNARGQQFGLFVPVQ